MFLIFSLQASLDCFPVKLKFSSVLDIIWHLSVSGYFDIKYLYISMQDDFDVDKFVADCRKRVQLEEMREDLEQYYRLLKTAMVELINKDYADFVNLSTNLVSLCIFRTSHSIFSRIVPPKTVLMFYSRASWFLSLAL